MPTVLDLCQAAGEACGWASVGQPINAQQGARALWALNSQIDSWNLEDLTLYALLEVSATLTPSKAAYTIGTSGTPDINAQRPISIDNGRITDATGNNYRIDFIDQYQWNQIGLRTVTSQIPDTGFYDPQFPNGIINIFPIPIISYTLFVDALLQLTQFASLQTVFSMPPGYQRMLELNLAVISEPYFRTKCPDMVKTMAATALANVKRKNMREVIAEFDPIMRVRGTQTYNIYRDR